MAISDWCPEYDVLYQSKFFRNFLYGELQGSLPGDEMTLRRNSCGREFGESVRITRPICGYSSIPSSPEYAEVFSDVRCVLTERSVFMSEEHIEISHIFYQPHVRLPRELYPEYKFGMEVGHLPAPDGGCAILDRVLARDKVRYPDPRDLAKRILYDLPPGLLSFVANSFCRCVSEMPVEQELKTTLEYCLRTYFQALLNFPEGSRDQIPIPYRLVLPENLAPRVESFPRQEDAPVIRTTPIKLLRRVEELEAEKKTLGEMNKILEAEGFPEVFGAGVMPCPTKSHEIVRENKGARTLIRQLPRPEEFPDEANWNAATN